jgi:hypothetical protein
VQIHHAHYCLAGKRVVESPSTIDAPKHAPNSSSSNDAPTPALDGRATINALKPALNGRATVNTCSTTKLGGVKELRKYYRNDQSLWLLRRSTGIGLTAFGGAGLSVWRKLIDDVTNAVVGKAASGSLNGVYMAGSAVAPNGVSYVTSIYAHLNYGTWATVLQYLTDKQTLSDILYLAIQDCNNVRDGTILYGVKMLVGGVYQDIFEFTVSLLPGDVVGI